MKSHFVFYGLLIFALLMLFQISKFWSFGNERGHEIFVLMVAIVSIVIGIYFGKNKSLIKKNGSLQDIDQNQIESLNISSREYEVLQLISKGHSNKEIAEKLFLSESTIKTHVSSLLLKLDAKRRTQAVTIAKDLNIIN
tara:strand:- start:882 stop:1298 length:417 start_codon:yes stop_codon:yes gene_type:complete